MIVIHQPEPEPQVVLDRTVWLAADMRTVVEDGDPRARSLLGTAGKRIPLRRAEELGLTRPEDLAADEAEPEEKAAARPADKQRRGAGTKET